MTPVSYRPAVPEPIPSVPKAARPLGVTILLFLDIIFLGILPLILIFPLFAEVDPGFGPLFTEILVDYVLSYMPSLALAPMSASIFIAMLLWNLVVLYALFRAWKGGEDGRVMIIVFIAFIEMTQLEVLSMMFLLRASHDSGFDAFGYVLIGRTMLACLTVGIHWWYLSRPAVRAYFGRATH